MSSPEASLSSDVPDRARHAEELLAAIFKGAGWSVRRPLGGAPFEPDLVARRRGLAYAAEVKSAPEGRGDRLVPLFAQAVLQAARAAGDVAKPLAVVAAPKIGPRAAEQVLRFAQDYAPDAAAGVIDFDGLALFRGPQLEALNASAQPRPASRSARLESSHLFSDLNQWLLKVLLAPELPEALLSAPRGEYRNASQLARAAGVSVMSAFRFVQQAQRESYLDPGAPQLNLVRLEDLFSRWQALAGRSAREAPMRFVLRGDPQAQLRKMLARGRACLALFAAADALGLGHVRGVPPYVYVPRMNPGALAAWRNVRPCEPGEAPDVIVRQAPAPQSVFRGMVRPEGVPACDVLQVWADVAAHPSRGREQADLIRKRVLGHVIHGKR
jgi:hypothetical protein